MGLVERPGQRNGVAGDLGGGGIGQDLPLAAEQGAQQMHQHGGQDNSAVDQHWRSAPAALRPFLRWRVVRLQGRSELLEKIGQRADQGHVKGVTARNMGQLVGGDRLDLIARAVGQEALCDGHGGYSVGFDQGLAIEFTVKDGMT